MASRADDVRVTRSRSPMRRPAAAAAADTQPKQQPQQQQQQASDNTSTLEEEPVLKYQRMQAAVGAALSAGSFIALFVRIAPSRISINMWAIDSN